MKLGLNIDKWGMTPIDDLIDLGIQAVRLVPRRGMEGYYAQLQALGIDIIFVLDSDSLTTLGFDSWAGSLEWIANTLAHYAAAIQVGNEPDHVSPSSWWLSKREFNFLLNRARHYFGPEKYLIAGGLVSGNVDWLNGIELDWVNAIAVHPYGRAPDQLMYPHWYFGYASDLIRAYRKKLTSLGRTDKMIEITEFGAHWNDFNAYCYPEDTVCREYLKGLYIQMMVETFQAMGDEVGYCLLFGPIPDFGIYDAYGDRQRSYGMLKEVAQAPLV
jgi:hypothetical protein